MSLERMAALASLLVVPAATFAQQGPPQSTNDQVTLRLDVLNPPARTIEENRESTRVEILVPASTEVFRADFEVVVESLLEPCVSDPDACGELFVTVNDRGEKTYGCADGIDNDENGLTDHLDPGCTGAQGWTIVVATDESLALYPDPDGVHVDGTLAADDTAGGLADTEGSFIRYQNVVRPDRNNGQNGVVAACILSFLKPVVLAPIGDAPVLRLAGDFDVSDLEPGESTPPALLEFRGFGEEGLSSFGEPTISVFTVQGETLYPAQRDLEVVITKDLPPPFRRSDTNSDGSIDVSDSITIFNFLFLGHRAPECIASADTDDSGSLEITDGIAVFNFLFFGATPPAAPGPLRCGPDPTPDDLPCEAYSSC